MACTNHPEQVIDLVRCSRCGGEFCRDCVVELKGDLFCANCKREQVRDIQSGADTTVPRFASVGKRFTALFLDGILLNILNQAINAGLASVIAGILAASASREEAAIKGFAIGFGIAFAVMVTYEALMLQWRGQTLGKMAAKVKVVTPEGDDISAGQAWLRAIMKQLLAIPLGLTFWVALFNKEKKTLHDSIAKTRVIEWAA